MKPQLATLKSKAPKGEQWLHEIKFDGYRIQIHINRGKRTVYTRNGLDWTKRFSVIAGALDIPGQAIIDGEVVVVHEVGPISPNSKPNLPPADKISLSTMRSICCGAIATCARGPRLSAN